MHNYSLCFYWHLTCTPWTFLLPRISIPFTIPLHIILKIELMEMWCINLLWGMWNVRSYLISHSKRNAYLISTHPQMHFLWHLWSSKCNLQGDWYFITFVDDHSQIITIYPIKRKSDALKTFKDFLVEPKCQTGHKLEVLHTDGDGKYLSNDFIQYLTSHRIVHEKSPPV